ncbi:DUF952 domain-containing protein [Microbacterium aoyamense]|uniref:DUF952 domain-containing protein n=2 Tax=Microbacterium aoyamense TaxID=344166 RepID=A0ABP5B1B9_9MICO|nr:DUF952 domain-containing protein [Microbacterium aoyamense]
MILHLASTRDWEAAVAVGEYRTSTRGATLDEVGFVHASHPEQLARVAEFAYADADEPLCVLVIDESRVRTAGVPVVEEDGGDGELFPHIYGTIRTEFVVDVIDAGFDDHGNFRMSRSPDEEAR